MDIWTYSAMSDTRALPTDLRRDPFNKIQSGDVAGEIPGTSRQRRWKAAGSYRGG